MAVNANFHFFPIIIQWQLNYKSSYPIGTKKKKTYNNNKKTKPKQNKQTKKNYSFPLLVDAICEIW